MSQMIVTRFAPSPTGYLHIGGARTALFNWLYARGRGGQFLLRIEDTDRARSTPEATQAILDGLTWLGLDWDGDAISQHARRARHAEVAMTMLNTGAAYKCYATQDEIAAFRETAKAEGRSTLFLSPWRDAPDAQNPEAPYVVRLKAPREGETVIDDQVQGKITISNAELDDMVLLRSDGSPTYMLAVVVDDHDMGVTHIIRGDDHLNNAARQIQIYTLMGWEVPVWAHIPLIHGLDGKKLSKRHGSLGLTDYAAMGYPARAVRNYLARLGWSHGDAEVFTDMQAREWFDFTGIGRAPARLDLKKLENISGKHIAMMAPKEFITTLSEFLALSEQPPLSAAQRTQLEAAAPILQSGARTFFQIIEKAQFLLAERPIALDEKAQKTLTTEAMQHLCDLTPHLQNAKWTKEGLEAATATVTDALEIGFGKLASPLRAVLAGRTVTPSVFDMMLLLGRDETIARISDVTEV